MGNVVDFDPRKKRSGPSRPHPRFENGQLADWIPGVALAAGITILATAMLTSPMASGIGCDIKGNVSTTGERIFHVPGQEYYRETIVSPLRGERWFCSEEAAREAGWRKAYR
ncbi:hypothetical protein N181_19655 [Sinorhizobium fredii USDA 205]|nr:hypothetical protein N181_19655 [Sinorhizobium fredii USDA 205]GEC32170.1 hypothetical protein EFR01_23410 [Sinorhizobium fredii]GLS07390.1 hypothetical protein GCM10007864_10170 [Sinorhizobium fredii]